MKLLAINGSYRGKHGQTELFLKRIMEGAGESGAQTETIYLCEKNIQLCKGCFSCQTKINRKKCIHDGKDDVASIFDKMRQADMLVYASPIYVFGFSAVLKALFERINSTADCADLQVSESGLFFHEIDKTLCSKPFATLFTCDNMEEFTPRTSLEYFKVFSRFMDAPWVGSMVRSSANLFKGDASKMLPKIPETLEAFRKSGQELATNGRISARTVQMASRLILPVPMLELMMKITPLKPKMVERARQMMEEIQNK